MFYDRFSAVLYAFYVGVGLLLFLIVHLVRLTVVLVKAIYLLTYLLRTFIKLRCCMWVSVVIYMI